jgi:hypothetical protein
MPDYSNGKIYKLVSDHTNKIYVGSTTQMLCARLAGHKKDFNSWKNNGKKQYISSFDLLELGEVKIILLENYSCKTKEELYARERFHIESLDCVNKVIPLRTMKEYLKDKKEVIKKQRKEYYEINKEKINLLAKEYRFNNKEKINEQRYKILKCECGQSYAMYNISRHLKSKKHTNFLSK